MCTSSATSGQNPEAHQQVVCTMDCGFCTSAGSQHECGQVLFRFRLALVNESLWSSIKKTQEFQQSWVSETSFVRRGATRLPESKAKAFRKVQIYPLHLSSCVDRRSQPRVAHPGSQMSADGDIMASRRCLTQRRGAKGAGRLC